MLRRRKLLWAAAALCAALAVWVGYEHWVAPSGPSYQGKTAEEWRVELRRWEPCGVSYGGSHRWTVWFYGPPAHEVWLAKLGVTSPSSDAKLALLEGDSEAVPVLLELLKSPSPKARRVAAQGLWEGASKLAPPFPAVLLDEAHDDVGEVPVPRPVQQVVLQARSRRRLHVHEGHAVRPRARVLVPLLEALEEHRLGAGGLALEQHMTAGDLHTFV